MPETDLRITVDIPDPLTIHDALQGLAAAARDVTQARGAIICIPDPDPARPEWIVVAASGAALPVGSRLTDADMAYSGTVLPLPGSAGQPGTAPGCLILVDPAGPVSDEDGAVRALRTAAGFALQ